MKLFPLMDRTGTIRFWAERRTGWIGDLNGNIVALISFDGVFRARLSLNKLVGLRAITYETDAARSC